MKSNQNLHEDVMKKNYAKPMLIEIGKVGEKTKGGTHAPNSDSLYPNLDFNS